MHLRVYLLLWFYFPAVFFVESESQVADERGVKSTTIDEQEKSDESIFVPSFGPPGHDHIRGPTPLSFLGPGFPNPTHHIFHPPPHIFPTQHIIQPKPIETPFSSSPADHFLNALTNTGVMLDNMWNPHTSRYSGGLPDLNSKFLFPGPSAPSLPFAHPNFENKKITPHINPHTFHSVVNYGYISLHHGDHYEPHNNSPHGTNERNNAGAQAHPIAFPATGPSAPENIMESEQISQTSERKSKDKLEEFEKPVPK